MTSASRRIVLASRPSCAYSMRYTAHMTPMGMEMAIAYSFNLLEASKDQTIAANIAAQYAEANNLVVSVLRCCAVQSQNG